MTWGSAAASGVMRPVSFRTVYNGYFINLGGKCKHGRVGCFWVKGGFCLRFLSLSFAVKESIGILTNRVGSLYIWLKIPFSVTLRNAFITSDNFLKEVVSDICP